MDTELDSATVISERLQRQRLVSPIKKPTRYLELFRLLQPVSTIYHARPGDPPCLVHRTLFDDSFEADRLRSERIIIKGRFLKGNIGYVLAEDLSTYANAFCRRLPFPNKMQSIVLEAVQNVGPLTPRQIKEETGLLNKAIMPVLHQLQKSFLVYEDQVDNDWERGWYDFATEWPHIKIADENWKSAAAQVVMRFLQAHVFATLEQIKDWSGFSAKRLTALVNEMEKEHLIISKTIDRLGQGWIRVSDCRLRPNDVKRSVFMLHKADPLVRSHASELKRRFGEFETLEYLLIDGKFQGAVLGHWRIKPHDVEDVVVELPTEEKKARQQEILSVVKQKYRVPFSRILKYAGQRIAN